MGKSLKALYQELDSKRSGVLSTARDCAKLTIPSLLPDENTDDNTVFDTPYQSIGSEAVNSLSSKLLTALLPSSSSFFRLTPNAEALNEAMYEGGVEVKSMILKKLSEIEKEITSEIDRSALRVPTAHAFKLLITTGNALVNYQDKKMRVFNLNQYVCARNPMGYPTDIVVKETMRPYDLPESIQGEFTGETVDVYTGIIFNGKDYDIFQEAGEIEVPETRGVIKKDNLNWLPLRWTSVQGENYGRGLAEHYLGDLRTIEALTQAVVEAAGASSKVLFMVNPKGMTNIKEVAKSKNGAIIKGRAEDVQTLQVQKTGDLRVAEAMLIKLAERISRNFLSAMSARRDAERVTAEEIRLMANELESTLGGVYSVLSQEFQLPLVKMLIKDSGIKLPKDLVEPVIITGLEALSRTNEYNKLVTFSQSVSGLLGPQAFTQYANADAIIDKIAMSLGLDIDGLIKSPEQMQQEQEQAMMMQSAQAGLDQAAVGVGQQMVEGEQ